MKQRLSTLLRLCFLLVTTAWIAAPCIAAVPADSVGRPPEQTKPWCYWYWISDNISKEGITRDLEAMKRVGIGEALIGNIFLSAESGGNVRPGKVKVLSPEWWELVEHAIREGGRIGVDIGVFNCPGWSQSGGPWIQPEQTMRHLVSSEIRVTGPLQLGANLPKPAGQFQDVAVLAFPAPANDTDTLARHSPQVSCTPPVPETGDLLDNNPATSITFPAGDTFTVDFELKDPITARSLELVPADYAFSTDVELLAQNGDGTPAKLRTFRCDWSNLNPAVGFIRQPPVVISFPATTARKFWLVFSSIRPGGRKSAPGHGAALAEIKLSAAARLERVVEKQLGKMHPTPLPMWDTYLWPTPAEPDSIDLSVPVEKVHNISRFLGEDGNLHWEVPAGDWVIQRIGMTPTGMSNSPASPEGSGFEVDKMNRKLAQYHFESFIGELVRRIPPAERKALKHVVADSYEMGAQNWTDGFDAEVQKSLGYDPKPWLPVLTGRLVGSADQSERFLWDLRRVVADRVATEYVGGLRQACEKHGLELWLENYGHWGFPSEFLKYGSESDRVGGEYWVTGDLGSIECRAAASCANTYGKRFVSAEAFTGGPPFQNAPGDLKARGDWSFCEGVNHFVLHVYIHQPWSDKKPGINAPWGTEFNRNNTWFDQAGSWIDYLRNCCWQLQQGNRVADVAYFIGDDAPKMTGVRDPELPAGYDFDYINSDVIINKLGVRNGVLMLPHGTQYRVLVLPNLPTMRPEVLRKIRNLVKAGATVLGPRPLRSPSLKNYPRCDDEVRKLASEIWGDEDMRQPGERKFGAGRVLWGKKLEEVFASLNLTPDFQSSVPLRFTHRRTAREDIYFVANPKAEPLATMVSFRAGARRPKLFHPETGAQEFSAVYDVTNGLVQLPIVLGSHQSVFVRFGAEPDSSTDRIISVTRNGATLFDARQSITSAHPKPAALQESFTIEGWALPENTTTLFEETSKGVRGISEPRNEIIYPAHGSQFGDPGKHAGCGLAVGTNGVVVYEHAASYFVPILVYPAQITNWTHIAVIYQDNQPSLYLDGKLTHTGHKSSFIVHPGDVREGDSFVGERAEFTKHNGVLQNEDLLKMAAEKPHSNERAIPVTLAMGTDSTGKLAAPIATVRAAGDYQFTRADGKISMLKVADLPDPVDLSTDWKVDFADLTSVQKPVDFEKLIDWTKHSNPQIKYYSGKATYRKSFRLPAGFQNPRTGERFFLDLGNVCDLATVRVNGTVFASLWMAPWHVDITDALRIGSNVIEVDIVNVWNNRLVGDAALPEKDRTTSLALQTVGSNAPLMKAGLLGPVTVRSIRRMEVP